MALSGLASIRNHQVLGSDVRVPTPYGTVRLGIG